MAKNYGWTDFILPHQVVLFLRSKIISRIIHLPLCIVVWCYRDIPMHSQIFSIPQFHNQIWYLSGLIIWVFKKYVLIWNPKVVYSFQIGNYKWWFLKSTFQGTNAWAAAEPQTNNISTDQSNSIRMPLQKSWIWLFNQEANSVRVVMIKGIEDEIVNLLKLL